MKEGFTREIRWQSEAVPGFTSVIIPVYRDVPGLTVTLTSLAAQDRGREAFEIIVANDGADPEVTEVAGSFGAKVLEITPNLGPYFARNRALELSKGDTLAFLDADMSVPPGWIGAGLKLIGKSDYVAGEILIDESLIRSPIDWYMKFNDFDIRGYLEESHFGATGCLFVKRGVIEAIGGFEERIHSGGDQEFGTRVYGAGFSQAFMAAPPAIHPPRGYGDFKRKVRRVQKGVRTLSKLFPERYGHYGSTPMRRFIHMWLAMLPPAPGSFKSAFPERGPFSVLTLYLLLWKLKVLTGYYSFLGYLSPATRSGGGRGGGDGVRGGAEVREVR